MKRPPSSPFCHYANGRRRAAPLYGGEPVAGYFGCRARPLGGDRGSREGARAVVCRWPEYAEDQLGATTADQIYPQVVRVVPSARPGLAAVGAFFTTE